MLKEAFGPSIHLQRKRWMIGVDGWLEDVVITLEALPANDAARQAAFRDGLATLHAALFGTAQGSEIERIIDATAGAERLAVPTHHVTPIELRKWLTAVSVR